MDDLTDRLARLDPPVHPPVLTGAQVTYCVDDTALGSMLFAVRDDGRVVASVFLVHDSEDAVTDRLARLVSPSVLRGVRQLDRVRREVEQYLAGTRQRFDVVLDPVLATPFQAQVLRQLSDVPYGTTTTYGGLAAAMGRPSASRAVGTALGANPLCLLLPCHRVIAGTGALTGYAGGVDAKRRLLQLESQLRQPPR